MVKKSITSNAVAESSNVATFELNEITLALAARFGLNLADAKDARVDRAAQNMNRSMHCMIAAGLDLASLQADCEHGEFIALIEERGFEKTGAYRAINYTQFLLSRSADERERLLTMPKSKVLALASADAAVIDDLLAEGEDGDLDALSVRELRQRIRDLQANNTDLSTQVDTAEAERDSAVKRLNKRNQREDDAGVPVVMADIRAEIAALVKKAELALDSFAPLGTELMGYRGHAEAGVWVDPTGHLALAGLVAVRVIADGAIARYVEALGLNYSDFASKPDALAFLQPDEILAVAQEWPELAALHGHEEALRKYERDQAKPKGKGRPANAPEAPKTKGRG